ncbi:hypothetical protein Hte_005173 [Hypoxylon texense]
MDDLEAKILGLDHQPSVEQQMQVSDSESRKRDKRTQWLDTAYLKNSLVTWSIQLSKMVSHSNELNDTIFRPSGDSHLVRNGHKYAKKGNQIDSRQVETPCYVQCELGYHEECGSTKLLLGERAVEPERYMGEADESHKHEMRKIGTKINDRLHAIIKEYEEKIRECSMRIDGMAMATQWSYGETNVEIALATGRDSRLMRSIAVVTMMFLPDTFFATIFFMQFFNWMPDGDEHTIVSNYFWIYVLVTVVTTILTLGTWCYFVPWREKRKRYASEEEDHPVRRSILSKFAIAGLLLKPFFR